MTRQILAAGALALSVACLGPVAAQDRQRSHDFNISINTQGDPLTSCDQIEATARNAYLARGEERLAVPRAAAGATVRISAPRNGGLHVRGASRSDYDVRLCKFAAGGSMADAAAVLDRVTLTVRDGVVTTTGPAEGGWTAHMIVQAPPDVRLALDAQNGPLSVEATSGRLVARALNGPLSVRGCSGDIEADAQNGPLAIADAAGTVRATARNGPLSVVLSGSAWRGEGLDARADNGPLSLTLPAAYASGVEVKVPTHGPFSCRAPSCGNAVRHWDDRTRQLQFGGPTPVVRISAINGPVDIH